MVYTIRMLSIIKDAALKVGELHRSYFRQKLTHTQKSAYFDIVTEADLKSQEIAVSIIEKEMQKQGISMDEIGYMGEENLQKKGRYMVVIDPLDGTANFAAGIDFFGVSIGMFVDGILTYGAIYQAIPDILTYAEKGKGAFMQTQGKTHKLEMTKTDTKKMYFCGGLSRDAKKRKKLMRLYDDIYPYFWNHISLLATAPILSLVADDAISLYINSSVGGLWDIAAGKLIVEESGGVMKDWQGNDLVLDLHNRNNHYPFVACHPKTLPFILEHIQKIENQEA